MAGLGSIGLYLDDMPRIQLIRAMRVDWDYVTHYICVWYTLIHTCHHTDLINYNYLTLPYTEYYRVPI